MEAEQFDRGPISEAHHLVLGDGRKIQILYSYSSDGKYTPLSLKVESNDFVKINKTELLA